MENLPQENEKKNYKTWGRVKSNPPQDRHN